MSSVNLIRVMLPCRWKEIMPYKSRKNNKGYIFKGKYSANKLMSLNLCPVLHANNERICWDKDLLPCDRWISLTGG